MGKKAPLAANNTTNDNQTQSPAQSESLLKIAHPNPHADLVERPTTVEGWRELMHVFIDTQPPALANATIETLKRAGIYGAAVKKQRHHFEGAPNDFTKGFGSALSLAHSIIATMIRHEVEQVIKATENAPSSVKTAAFAEAFQTVVKGGMVSTALALAAERAYKLSGQMQAMSEAQRQNTGEVVHAFGIPLAELIVAENSVPPGATVN